MKIKKSELLNILNKDWSLRRAASKERSLKKSKAAKDWKARFVSGDLEKKESGTPGSEGKK